MCIKLRWDDHNDNVLHQIFESGWTLQAYQHSMEALDVMVSHHPEPVQVVMDMSAAPTAPVRMRPGRSVDEAAATHSVERIILVAPGHFMPRVDCPVDVVETIDEAKSLLSAQSPSLIPA